MQNELDETQQNENSKDQRPTTENQQEQTDPQLTELRGLTDTSEDLEPTLTDGTKAPEKAKEEYKHQQ
jgi:hypothetical protein